MKILIVGDGKVGFALTRQLAKEGHDIVVIDSNRSVLEDSVNALDVMVVHGNGASLRVLRDADVEHHDLVIAATSSDEINMLCCFMARKLGVAHTIARVRLPDYADQLFFMKEELGLSMVINPERSAAGEIFSLIQYPSFLKRDSFAKGRVEIVEIEVEPTSPIAGKKLMNLHQITKLKVLVCAVERGDEITIPDGHFTIQSGDKIYVTAPRQSLGALISHLGIKMHKINNVLMIGASNTALYLTKDLIAAGIAVKIIDKDEKRCERFATEAPRATLICADGSDHSVLLSEDIEQTDAVVTLTNIDEQNLLISMYANHIGVPKVITKINRSEYLDMLHSMRIDSLVVPKLLAVHEIVRYVRAMQNAIDVPILTLHRMMNDSVEALEFLANEKTLNLGRTLNDISFKPNILIACILRGGVPIIPGGSDTIKKGDTIIVVAGTDRMFDDLNDIFD